ncbi:MAG TPA: hypothetical protein VNO17_02030 [Actinomycetota bacterium]|nr:hypothetical protein [Actinomycetota bacterium]
MAERPVHRTALGLGLFFVAAGVVFLLERLGVLAVGGRLLLPLLLIGLGVALLVTARRR